MSKPLLALLFVLATFKTVAGRIHSLPEDPHAFPKFKTVFLNNLPVLNETAQKWLVHGIPGGELEFLDQPWEQPAADAPMSRKEIDAGLSGDSESDPPVPSGNHISYSLEHMKLGPRDSYLCLVPKPLGLPPPPSEDDTDEDITPARSWSLLQPLTGTCLYHRQGWFTYSYCHNDQIRQFRENFQQVHSHIPEEDHSSDSYTLGKAPATPEPGADLTLAERNAIEANLELARGAGSRYLVQRWGDGSICDKTGKGREVEVQFHCSMAMSDTILFVKEAKTCSYVLVINTPRLCGEPGFRSHRDVSEQAHIRCREIVHTQSEQFYELPETDHPQKIPRVKQALPPKVATERPAAEGDASAETSYDKILRKTLEAIMGVKPDLQDGQVILQKLSDDSSEMVIEFLEDPEDEGEDGAMDTGLDKIASALRAAGFEIKGAKGTGKPTGGESSRDNENEKRAKSNPKGSTSEQQHAVGDDYPEVRDEL